ncbi:MAG: hypothetical protein A2031_05160 [Deltaproteobacteria bacterium RBG_19FT_COMBO_43_11]|nr:MAG: hypothetical protein A2W27_10500 [Deltaproteobacteria bacterium RBG_16_44_11]OGP87639.1 MAG: hypothetical protein A2031_05160 [Deltaproteobacteria bacterium RBG_19FT_COMBO_43_11]
MEAKDINFAAMPQIAVNVVTKPAEFFKKMPKTGGFLEPLIFAAIMGFITGIIHFIINILGLSYIEREFMGSVGLVIFLPLAAVVGSFVGAAIIYVIWKLMGSEENYETSYRCAAYLMALAPIVAIIGIIPYVGGLINMAIYVYYIVIASTQVHNIASQKAWLVFGIIGAIFALIGITAEYKARNMFPTAEQYRRTADEINKQYQQHLEEARKEAARNR